MKVYENETVRREVLELLGAERRFLPRVWSVTNLTCCPRRTYWRFKRVEWKPEKPEELQLLFTRGRAHHEILEVYPDRERKMEKDGVYGHYDTKGRRIIEIFTTTLGSKRMSDPSKVIEVFTMKVRQLMAYLYMEGESEGDLMVFYLMGDYSRPIKPELKDYTLVFEERELEENWDFLLGRKKMIEDCLKRGVPPIEVGFKWECSNCGYAYACEEFLQEKYEETVEKLMEIWGIEV